LTAASVDTRNSLQLHYSEQPGATLVLKYVCTDGDLAAC